MAHRIYDDGGRLTREESSARKFMLNCIRLAFLSREPSTTAAMREASDAFKPYLEADVYLSEAYRALDTVQRAALREGISNPRLRAFDNGKEMWVDANNDLLGRLERGDDVGPTHRDADC